jgi:hypothetical protein
MLAARLSLAMYVPVLGVLWVCVYLWTTLLTMTAPPVSCGLGEDYSECDNPTESALARATTDGLKWCF